MASPSLLIIMTRYPTPGRCKTRLIPALGPEGAARLSAALSRWTLLQAAQFSGSRPVSVELHFEGGDAGQMAELFGAEWNCVPQTDGDLGARLHHAVGRAFDRGFHSIVVIGTDCPMLDAPHLSSAFDALESTPVVVGPSTDGGYYLLGVACPAPELFREIPWGSETVLERTLQIAETSGLRVTLLDPLTDIDTARDLFHLPDEIAALASTLLPILPASTN